MRFLLIFLLFIPLSTFAEWEFVKKSKSGSSFYIDKDKITKDYNYIYFWSLVDFSEPAFNDDLSAKTYSKVNCDTLEKRDLEFYFYKEPMGNGNEKFVKPSIKEVTGWRSFPKNVIGETVLLFVCKEGWLK